VAQHSAFAAVVATPQARVALHSVFVVDRFATPVATEAWRECLDRIIVVNAAGFMASSKYSTATRRPL